MKTYRAGKGAQFSDKDAQKIGEVLEKLQKPENPITAEIVLQEASNPKSILHSFFDWDDSSAAHQYRLVQARKLVHGLRIIVEIDGEKIEKRAFANVRVQVGEEVQKGYMPMSVITKSQNLNGQVIQKALDELNSWVEKYMHYEELSHVIECVRKAYMDYYEQ